MHDNAVASSPTHDMLEKNDHNQYHIMSYHNSTIYYITHQQYGIQPHHDGVSKLFTISYVSSGSGTGTHFIDAFLAKHQHPPQSDHSLYQLNPNLVQIKQHLMDLIHRKNTLLNKTPLTHFQDDYYNHSVTSETYDNPSQPHFILNQHLYVEIEQYDEHNMRNAHGINSPVSYMSINSIMSVSTYITLNNRSKYYLANSVLLTTTRKRLECNTIRFPDNNNADNNNADSSNHIDWELYTEYDCYVTHNVFSLSNNIDDKDDQAASHGYFFGPPRINSATHFKQCMIDFDMWVNIIDIMNHDEFFGYNFPYELWFKNLSSLLLTICDITETPPF